MDWISGSNCSTCRRMKSSNAAKCGPTRWNKDKAASLPPMVGWSGVTRVGMAAPYAAVRGWLTKFIPRRAPREQKKAGGNSAGPSAGNDPVLLLLQWGRVREHVRALRSPIARQVFVAHAHGIHRARIKDFLRRGTVGTDRLGGDEDEQVRDGVVDVLRGEE